VSNAGSEWIRPVNVAEGAPRGPTPGRLLRAPAAGAGESENEPTVSWARAGRRWRDTDTDGSHPTRDATTREQRTVSQ